MKFFVQINLDNAAFDEDPQGEVSRILRELADKLDEDLKLPNMFSNLRDINGNPVGVYAQKPDAYAIAAAR